MDEQYGRWGHRQNVGRAPAPLSTGRPPYSGAALGRSPIALSAVPRRIDIELTSTRPDGTWTWRAAGAKEPKGVLDGSLLFDGAKAGDVVKAEADFEIEGITILSVSAPKADARNEPQRIEILGPPRPDTPGVTTQLVGRQERRGPGRRREGDQRPRGDRGERSDRGARDAGRGPDRRHTAGTDRPERPSRDGAAQGERRERPRRGEGAHRGDGPDKRGADRGPRADGAASKDGPRRPARRPERERTPAPQDDRGAKRLNPGHAHRHAILESLAPEQRPIAEQVLRGGIPAVRTALHLEREKAEAEGRPAPNTDQLVAMAEDLLPRLKAAEWRDRAEAAVKMADEISIRDLRSVVAGSDAARDEETRALAATLRETLERRLDAQRSQWSEEITRQLDEGRVVRALRLSSRPPEPAARLDDELSKRLAEAAGESMSPTASSDLWLALLDAAVASPVRRAISPAGLPPDAAEVRQAALQQSSRIPALASMLGVSIPPPPVRKAPPERRGAPRPRRDTDARRRPREDSTGSETSSPAARTVPPAEEPTEAPARSEEAPPASPEPVQATAPPVAQPAEPDTVEAVETGDGGPAVATAASAEDEASAATEEPQAPSSDDAPAIPADGEPA